MLKPKFLLTKTVPITLLRYTQGSYVNGDWVEGTETQVEIKANIKSAVAGNPNDSEVSSNPGSLLLYPPLVVWVAVTTGTLNSTANPLNSSAIAFT